MTGARVSWFGKVAFGSLGLLLGGPLGAMLGAAIGHHLVDKQGEGQPANGIDRTEQAQAAYFVCMFSILGKLAKADGIVSQEELAIVERFLNSMPISPQEKAFARQVFNEAKTSPYTIDDFATQLYTISQQQPALLVSFLNVLFQVAAADGRLDGAEEAALRRVKEIFRISDQQFDNLKASYFKDVEKYYRRLNCTAQSSNDEIKRNYKKLVKDFHPDTIVSKGLPEEFIEFATTRFREIQEAYEHVRRERAF